MDINKSSIVFFRFIMLCGIIIFTTNAEDVASHEMIPFSTDIFLKKQEKYLNGKTVELVTFNVKQAEDSEKTIERNGLLFIKANAPAVVLVCHGFMCDKFDIGFIRRALFGDYTVMLFDFRAHGENIDEDQCCTFGRDEALDVMGAVSYLKSRQDLAHLPLIAYGFSMGAVAAIQAQAQNPTLFSAMVLDCPFDSSENVLKRSIEKLKFNFFGYTFELPGKHILERFAFNRYVQGILKALLKTIAQLDATGTNTIIVPLSPAESIKKVTVPCFLIHCRNDEKIPIDAARTLFNNLPGYRRWWITNGRRHFDSIIFNPDKYAYKVNNFIKQFLSGELFQKGIAKIYEDLNL